MFVDDLSHSALGFVEDIGSHEQNHEDHGSLVCEGEGSVFGLRVGGHLFVDVVILDGNDDGLDHILVEGEHLEQLLGVVGGPRHFRVALMLHPEPPIRTQPPYLINSINILPTLIPVVAHHNPLPHFPLNNSIHQQ